MKTISDQAHHTSAATLKRLQRLGSDADLASPETQTVRRRLRACHECDLVSALPPLKSGEKALCPRCQHTLIQRNRYPAQRSMAFAVSALIALVCAIAFPFISFSTSGIGNRIDLTQTASQLLSFGQPLVAIAVIMTIVIIPGVYLAGVIWLQWGLLQRRPLALSLDIARGLFHLSPWMMADVFIIGALVSLIKIAGMAQIELGIAFWAFSAYAILLLLTVQSLDADWLWFSLARGEPRAPQGTRTGMTAAHQGLAGCATCGLINALHDASRHASMHKVRCRRCHEPLHTRHPYSIQATWALLIAATIMYLPANLYPIMSTTSFGNTSSSTIVGGVIELIEMGSWPIAAVIFVASVIVPISKLLAMAWLCVSAQRSRNLGTQAKIRLYRLTELIGRWSMVDIFVVAILVALIRAGTVMSITPGPAALAFASTVILTMLAAMIFDPRLLWDDRPATHAAPTTTYQESRHG